MMPSDAKRNIKGRADSPRLRLFCCLVILATCHAAARAQTISNFAGNELPVGVKPGSPSGSFGLSEIESVNIQSGKVSASIPLMMVGGRGGASYMMTQRVPQVQWSVDQYPFLIAAYPDYRWTWHSGLVNIAERDNLYPGYGPGVVHGRHAGKDFGNCGGSYNVQMYAETFTFVEFTAPDGTQHALYDEVSTDYGVAHPCTEGTRWRGRVFSARDGSGISFVSDTDIGDKTVPDPGNNYWENVFDTFGYLLMPDGTRYRVEWGLVRWITDRNGNKLTFAYDQYSRLQQVTDSLGRTVNIQYGYQDAAPFGLCDRVVYRGLGGEQRIIRVSSVHANGTVTGGIPDLFVLSSATVWLPDGSRHYHVTYNSSGEIARIELPSGGAVEYDHAAGVVGTDPSGQVGYSEEYLNTSPYQNGEGSPPFPPRIIYYRRLVERRLYPAGGTGDSYASRTTYSRPETGSCYQQYGIFSVCTFGGVDYVQEDSYDSVANGGQVVSSVLHHYNGHVAADMYADLFFFKGFPDTLEGKETLTEVLDGSGVVRSVSYAWQQRTRGPVTTDVTTTWGATGQVSSTHTDYDQYNNPTDVYESDYGQGARGDYVRRTHTEYEDAPAYTSALNGAHLRHLVKKRWVSADVAGNGKREYTDFAYDQYPLTDRPNITGLCTYAWGQFPNTVCSATGPNGEPPTAYTTRGNLTSVTHYAEAQTPSGGVTVSSHYDIAGNVVSATDAKGQTSYTDYGDGVCYGPLCGTIPTNTFAFAVSRTTPAPDASAELNLGFSPGTFGSTTPFTSTTSFEYYTGYALSATDPNGQSVNYSYVEESGASDPFDRLHRVSLPDGGWTKYDYGRNQYGDFVRTRVLLEAAGAQTNAYEYFDGLGRAYRSFNYENADPAKPWLTRDTEYDALGAVKRTSTLYRSAGSGDAMFAAGRWVETTYDRLGRVKTSKTMPDGGTVSTDYSGDRVLVRDQAGREVVSRTDALGRITHVWEVTTQDSATVGLAPFPDHPEAAYGYLSTYDYDPQGNLRTVTQSDNQTTQTRTFDYDALARLKSVTLPETGRVDYTYDANGNVETKADALGVVTRYRYDHLNRNIITTYTVPPSSQVASTPELRNYYDNAAAGAHGLGKLWKSEALSTALTTVDSYDVVGRPKQQTQQFWAGSGWGQAYTMQVDYNLGGNVTRQVYPSGHAVNYSYDSTGRLGDSGGQPAFAGNLGDGVPRTYVTEVGYEERGGLSQERYGTQTPVYNKHLYNSRGQLAEIRVSTYALTAAGHETDWNRGAIINHYSNAPGAWGATGGGADNNGNLLKQEVYIPHNDQSNPYTNIVQEYGYDALNRLNAVFDKPNNGASDFYQVYKYDRWGNRTLDSPGWNSSARQFTVNPNNNRLGVPAGQAGAMNYDAVGNLVNDSYTGYGDPTGQQHTRFYDAEGRIASAAQAYGTQNATYTYDAEGRRVKRKSASGETWQVYGIGGQLLAEYGPNGSPQSPQKEYGYRGGQLLIVAEAFSAGWGAPPVLNDNPLQPGQTTVQARHITELRDAINALRSHVSLGAYQWQAAAGVGALISAAPIAEMRTALDEALGAPAGGYSPGLASGQPIKAVHIQELRDRVLGAWQSGTGSSEVRWLVDDQIGTPRMIVDHTGSLAGVTRHDYMPFGEEVPGGDALRSQDRGYAKYDAVRQHFTGQERDTETLLDYFGARYYGCVQGRFTSPDPLLSTGRVAMPQSWNRYAYTLNNPLRYVDPTGLYDYAPNQDPDAIKKFEAAIKKAREQLAKIEKRYGKTSTEYTDATRALNAFGTRGDGNGVRVSFTSLDKGVLGDTVGTIKTTGANTVDVRIDLKQADSGNELLLTIAHEGSHVQDNLDFQSAFMQAAKSPSVSQASMDAVVKGPLNVTHGQSETRAYEVTSVFAEFTVGGGKGPKQSPMNGSIGMTIELNPEPVKSLNVGGEAIWNSSWPTDIPKLRANRDAAIAKGLAKDPRYSSKLNTPIQQF